MSKGESAFPHKTPVMSSSALGGALEKIGEQIHFGLTKRELIASMCMQGSMCLSLSESTADAQNQMRIRAMDAVFAADALISELNKQAEGEG